MRRRRVLSGRVRLLLALVVVSVAAGVVATSASALAFADTPCVEPYPGAIRECPDGRIGASYSIRLDGRSGCGPALPYQFRILAGALPSGLSLAKDGTISGTPTAAGMSRFWVELSDEDPPSAAWCTPHRAEREFSIRIGAGLVITTGSAPGAFTETPYSLALTAAMQAAPGQTSPVPSAPTWSVEGQLPPGLGLSAQTGIISGTPTTNGTYAFVVRATLPGGLSATKALSIEVKTKLSVAPLEALPASEVGRPLRITLGASGGTPGYTWSLTSGELPEGVGLTPAGVISGRPRLSGVYAFTASVADTSGQTAALEAELTVAPRLALTTTSLARGRVGTMYRATLASEGGVAPTRWRIARGQLPRGVKLLTKKGVLFGKPRKAGRYKLRIQVIDALGVRSTKSYRIVVAPKPKPKNPRKSR